MALKRLAIIASIAALTGCGSSDEGACGGASAGGNTLEGSYCEDIEMLFTDVALLLVASTKTLRIEYINGQRTQKTLRVLVGPENVMLEPDVEISLLDAGAIVQRFTPDTSEPIDLTNELADTSRLVFSEYTAEIDSSASGEFNLLFMSGRTLNGEFSGTVVDAEASLEN